jgi:hydroxymethylpyrimidine/phosphomethylpyrimidine kinase
MPRVIPKALTIAGSDSGGGAGIQADLKTFAALGVYGCSVITAVTAQNTVSVISIHEIPPEIVASQLDAVAQDIGANAVKTGMLTNHRIVQTVARKLREYKLPHLVVDPVIVTKSGQTLLKPDAIDALKEEIFPLAEVLTPNIPEAEMLVCRSLKTASDFAEAACDLLAMGPCAVIIKGGHRPRGSQVVDLYRDQTQSKEIRGPYIKNPHTHGTGCTFASAIAAGLAKGLNPYEAALQAREYLSGALEKGFTIGKGTSPVHHFHRWWDE